MADADPDATPNPRTRRARRIVAIGAGRGGVGASMIATNLGIFLAQIGKRVALIDANLPDSGLHAWLGAPRPERTISDVLLGRVERVEDALSETRVTGLYLLGGAPDLLGHLRLTRSDHDRLFEQLQQIDTDYLLIDSPSGLHPLALDLFGRADAGIAVTIATPDSVEATYRFVDAVFTRRLLIDQRIDPAARALVSALGSRPGRPPSPREVVAELAAEGSPGAEVAGRMLERFRPLLVVNETRIKADEELGESMVSAAARWLGVVPRLLGSVGWDDNVWLALRRGRTLLIDFPRSRACKDLERIVRRLISQDSKGPGERAQVPPPTPEQNLYELLEIYPGASEEEVRRALKRIREWFGVDGLAGNGACTDVEREYYQQRAEEAHATLVDKSKRRQYDRSAFPEGFSAERQRLRGERDSIAGTVAATQESLPEVHLDDDQLVDGEFLGRIRRERGVELIDISNRAKISTAYLQAIEEERFEDLPAKVFVRGFVTEFARFLKIDPDRAVSDFVAKLDAYRDQQQR